MKKSKVKKSFLIAALLVLLVLVSIGIGFVMAYGGSQPSVMGHSFGEINWTCTRVPVTGTASVTATCSSGKLVSGGCQQALGIVTYSIPNAVTNPTGWYCATTGTNSITAYALCCS